MKSIIRFFDSLASKYYPFVLFSLAFIDSFFLATPITTVFILFVLKKRLNISKCLISVMAGILAGALAGYTLGYFTLIRGEDWLIREAQLIIDGNAGFSLTLYYKIRSLYQSLGFLVMLAGTFTPIPFGMFSISSGLLKMNIFWFLIITITGHSIKYLLIAYLTIRAQSKIKSLSLPGRRKLFQAASVSLLAVITWLRVS